ncbi:MAG TPA: hypothetical protein VMI30_08525 [Stellaceae bacterium]|nr:hypothetical protein [Stellaceae bacterium]
MTDRFTSRQRSDNSWGTIWQFAAKIVIAAIVVTLALSYLIDNLVADVNDMLGARMAQLHAEIQSVNKIGGRTFWKNLQEQLDRAADPKNDLPPEQQKKLVEDVRALVRRARPFIDAVQSTLEEPTSKPAGQ